MGRGIIDEIEFLKMKYSPLFYSSISPWKWILKGLNGLEQKLAYKVLWIDLFKNSLANVGILLDKKIKLNYHFFGYKFTASLSQT